MLQSVNLIEILLGIIIALAGGSYFLYKQNQKAGASKFNISSSLKNLIKGEKYDAGKSSIAQAIKDFNRDIDNKSKPE